MIKLNDAPEVLDVLQQVQVGELGLEGIVHPGTKESHSDRGICTVPSSMYSIQMPADDTSITQLNVISGEWTSILGHSSRDPD